MITPELIAYIRKQLSVGVSRESITKSLVSNGWAPEDIAQAFTTTSVLATPVLANQKTKQASSLGVKLLVSIMFVIASAGYALFQYTASSTQAPVATSLPVSQNQNLPVSSPVVQPTQPSTGNTPVAQTPAASAPPPQPTTPVSVPTPSPKPAGQYADGTYTGSAADAYYGTVQVEAVVQNGALADVRFLQYPSDRSTSRYINSQAMPALTQEAVQAQSANVDIVSGATFTSQAFQESLGSALAQAKS